MPLSSLQSLVLRTLAGRRTCWTLLHIHDHHLPFGAVAWAAVGKDPGFSKESLIGEVRRNARYRADDCADLSVSRGADAADVSRRLKAALREAEAFVAAMPDGREGLTFLEHGRVVQPDPARLTS